MPGISFELATDPNYFGGPVVHVKMGNRVLGVIYPSQRGIEIKKSMISELELSGLAKGVKVEVSLSGEQQNIGSALSSEKGIKLESKSATSVTVTGDANDLRVKFD